MLVSMSLFMLMLVSMSIQVTIHTYNMGKHKTKTCNVCFKSMRGDKLKKHMKKHDGKTEDNIVTKGLHDGKYNSQKLNFKQPNVLMRHMKRHERENEDDILTKGVHEWKTKDNVTTKVYKIYR